MQHGAADPGVQKHVNDHLAQFETQDAPQRIAEIIQALQILAHSPLTGRLVKGGQRELVIGRGARGHVALHRFMADIDAVFVLAGRGQHESGYNGRRRVEHPAPGYRCHPPGGCPAALGR